ncbi:uncharacterized protein LOC144061878 isoform X2 [Vanacampus margaritifer]
MDSEPRSFHHRLDRSTQDAPQMSPASEDQDSLSFKGPSEDSEPNVSSLASHEDHIDDDNDDLMVEDGCYASQGTCPTSKQSSQFLADNTKGRSGLPSSESFADFCSASTQQDGGEKWGDFKDQNNRMQQLLRASFPETEVPAVSKKQDEEEEVPNLETLLHPQQLPDWSGQASGSPTRTRTGLQASISGGGLPTPTGLCLGVSAWSLGTWSPTRLLSRIHRNHLQGRNTHRPLRELNATEQPRS